MLLKAICISDNTATVDFLNSLHNRIQSDRTRQRLPLVGFAIKNDIGYALSSTLVDNKLEITVQTNQSPNITNKYLTLNMDLIQKTNNKIDYANVKSVSISSSNTDVNATTITTV